MVRKSLKIEMKLKLDFSSFLYNLRSFFIRDNMVFQVSCFKPAVIINYILNYQDS